MMEVYTPAFKAGIDAGAGSVMTAYNLVNGEWASQSKYVITDLLRGTLGFRGLVMTDWRSVFDWKKIVLSGQNVEMPGDPNQPHYINSIPELLCSDLPLFLHSSGHRGEDMQNFALAVHQKGYFIAQLTKIFNRKFYLIRETHLSLQENN